MSRSQPGYYPGFSTLAQQQFWDAATRNVILDRVHHVPERKFFTFEETRLMEGICSRVIPQDDREPDKRVPIVPWIDERLALGRQDGYRFESMPADGEAYRLGLNAIEQIARHLHGGSFCDLSDGQRDRILKSLHDGCPEAGEDIWKGMPVHRFWMLVVGDCAAVYYSHPYAWDEIGFGGPAYPRAYMRLEHGQPEPWEVAERRYEWTAPGSAISEEMKPVAGQEEHHAGPQGGTH